MNVCAETTYCPFVILFSMNVLIIFCHISFLNCFMTRSIVKPKANFQNKVFQIIICMFFLSSASSKTMQNNL